MKSFRYLIASLTVALFIGLLLTGCDDESQAQVPNNPESSIPPTPVYIPEINKEVKDSLDKYTARIDSISKATEKAIKDVENMKGDVLYQYLSLIHI